MSRWSTSQGVVLTAYHPSSGHSADQASGNPAEDTADASSSSRRSGQYTMNHDNSKKSSGKPLLDHSDSQDSLDELSMNDYWKELEIINETRSDNNEEQEAVVVKEPDEGELEEEWLKEAGLSNLFGDTAGDSQESIVVLTTLTRTQAAAVQKRVETVTQTMRKKNKQYQVPDVRDIFKQQNESNEKKTVNELRPVRTKENKDETQEEQNEESGLFGVPLSVLLEQDQKRVPGIKVPLVFQKLISQIEEGKLETEGLLRIPGVAARIKNLYQELEAKFYEGTFNWENVKQHDAASLLKLFIRELPQPLLTVEYLKAFQDVQKLPKKKQQLQALNLLVLLLPEVNRDTLKALLEFLQRVIDHRDENKMNLKNVAMVMTPNLFMFHGLGYKTIEQNEFVMAAGTAGVMGFMIKFQNLLWTIPTFLVNQVRKQNTESQKKERKEKAMRKLLKKMAYDREKHEKQDKSSSDLKCGNDADIPQRVIRVQAPHLSKVSMAIQLTEELKASDIVGRFLSQKSGMVQDLKKEEVFLYEVGGNIGERCLDDDTYMKALYQLNPNAEWVIKSKNC
ncbi:rho GTPase-activating protein 18 isoform X2 [Varanus komodoensis]|uniref:rho GTPase-activating protein 18 isoform X2 n=1 Tax=Varanus komodoensis TaxID=61221 RepID=UPI001CF76CE8|nr:rho GTPase-activating protein 18 isoform X2 [Varanus komodoensis]